MKLKEKRLKALKEIKQLWKDIHKNREGDMYNEDCAALGSALCPLCYLVNRNTSFDNCNKCIVMIVFGASSRAHETPCGPLVRKIRNQPTNADRSALAAKYINKMIRYVKMNG
jgi:hypothetical protein